VSAPEPTSAAERTSAPEPVSAREPVSAPEMRLASCPADIVELAALSGQAGELDGIARVHGRQLPPLGRIAPGRGALGADHLALCVRPQRWLLLGAPAAPGANAAHWQAACAGAGAAVDLSSALVVLHLGGGARELLVRGCRLDLSVDAFPPGNAAATLMVQVSVIIAALPSGMLLLTPASTAMHLREWISCTARGLGALKSLESSLAELAVAEPTGDPR